MSYNLISNSVKLGYEFEDLIHNIISQSEYIVLRENDIVKTYGQTVYGIDHMIKTTNFLVLIQDKWKNSKPGLQDINHFTKATERISDIEHKRCLCIYLSKYPITSYAEQAFNVENNKRLNRFITISSESQQQIIKILTRILYNNKIYFYESDGSAIMIR